MTKHKDYLEEAMKAINSEELKLENLEKNLKKQSGQLEEMIRANPLLSVAIAFGAGYLMAKLLNSSKGRRQ